MRVLLYAGAGLKGAGFVVRWCGVVGRGFVGFMFWGSGFAKLWFAFELVVSKFCCCCMLLVFAVLGGGRLVVNRFCCWRMPFSGDEVVIVFYFEMIGVIIK